MARNIFTVLSGSVFAQLIMLLSMPILSRYYNAESFGKYQIYVSSLNILLIFSSFRYEMALLSTKSNKHFEDLLKLVLIICLAVSAVAASLLLIGKDSIILNYPKYSDLLDIIPITILICGIHQIFTYIPIRNRAYQVSTHSKLLQSLTYIGGCLFFVHYPIGLPGLIISDLLARLFAGFGILHETPGIFSLIISRINLKSLRKSLYRFREYPFVTFPGSFLSAINAAIIPFALLTLFDLNIAGQYALVERFILMPVSIISAAIAQVVTGDFSKKFRTASSELNHVFRKTVLWLAIIAILPSIIGILNASWAVPKFFGDQWKIAGELCTAAIPIAFVSFVAAPVNMVLVICNRQKVQFTWEIFRFIFTVFLFIFIYSTGVKNPVLIVTWYAMSVMISYSVFLLFADIVTKQTDRNNR